MNSFTWEGFSCYMDTVLWVLFRRPCPFIRKHFLKSTIMKVSGERTDLEERFLMELQSILCDYQKKFSQNDTFTVKEFRDWFKRWWENPQWNRIRQWPPFHREETNEAHEFLQFLFSLKGMNGLKSYGMTVSEKVFYGCPWVKVKERKDQNASLIWNLPLEKTYNNILLRTETDQMRRVFRKKEYDIIKTQLEVVELADFFVLSVERLHDTTVSLSSSNIPFFIKDKNDKKLELQAVIVFWGETQDGHYSAFCRKGHKWLFYDDLQDPPVKIVEEVPMEIIQKHGVLFFFYP